MILECSFTLKQVQQDSRAIKEPHSTRLLSIQNISYVLHFRTRGPPTFCTHEFLAQPLTAADSLTSFELFVCCFCFRIKATMYEKYESKMHTNFSGFTVLVWVRKGVFAPLSTITSWVCCTGRVGKERGNLRYIFFFKNALEKMTRLPWHKADVPDHVPFAWQVRVIEPSSSYPTWHENVFTLW